MSASSPRQTNGSYTVPTGSSIVSCSSDASPSWPSSRNRFISEMPSSMCWPSGPGAHRSGDDSSDSYTSSAVGANTPRLLIHPPRPVEIDTSGDVVTRCFATSS